jgi:hypothetical protein
MVRESVARNAQDLDVLSIVVARIAASFIDPDRRFVVQDIEVETARMAASLDVVDQNLGFFEVIFRLVHAHHQGVDLRPEIANGSAFLLWHFNPLLNLVRRPAGRWCWPEG